MTTREVRDWMKQIEATEKHLDPLAIRVVELLLAGDHVSIKEIIDGRKSIHYCFDKIDLVIDNLKWRLHNEREQAANMR